MGTGEAITRLVIEDDEGRTTEVPLIREITIGRQEGNIVRLTERNVSRRHARILRDAGEVLIEDLGSYNGVWVNDARIVERVSLRINDQVQIGDYVLYLRAPITRGDACSSPHGWSDFAGVDQLEGRGAVEFSQGQSASSRCSEEAAHVRALAIGSEAMTLGGVYVIVVRHGRDGDGTYTEIKYVDGTTARVPRSYVRPVGAP